MVTSYTSNPFKPATKEQAKLRMALVGPSGSGKTYTALSIASALTGGKVAVIDTERGSARKYAGIFEFDVLELDNFHPEEYIAAIRAAVNFGDYDVLVIDGLSSAWAGVGGVLEIVDRVGNTKKGNKFAAWGEATPIHNRFLDAILGADIHTITTMRSKTTYVQEVDDKGRTVVRKMGLQPVQRDGVEYEFDVIADIDMSSNLVVSKTRCPALNGAVYNKAGSDIAEVLRDWLTDGIEPHWATVPGNQDAFRALLKELELTGAEVLATLEGNAGLGQLRDTTKTWPETVAHMQALGAQKNGAEPPETPADDGDAEAHAENGKTAQQANQNVSDGNSEYSADWLTDVYLKEMLELWALDDIFKSVKALRDFAKQPALNGIILPGQKHEDIAKRLRADFEGIQAAQEAEASS